MEESEKRRERLRAMRMEAAQVDAAGNGDEPALPSYLSNPLIESSATTLSQAEARFDFYTDPMAAFSSNKKKSNYMPPCYSGSPTSQILTNCAGTSNPESTPHAPQFQRDHSQGPSQSCSSAPYGSLVRTARPFPMNQATPMAGQWYQPHPAPSPGSGWNGRAMHGWAPQLGHSTSPQSNPSTSLGLGRGNWHTSPRAGLDRRATFAWGPRPSHSPSPRSSYPRPGRGRGGWSGTHTSHGSGQWISSHDRGSGIGKSLGEEGFYDESMLEDPWKFLEPVLWKNVNHSSKFRDLEQKSLATKRPRALESWSQPVSQSSLAEYLAASFKDAVEGEPSS